MQFFIGHKGYIDKFLFDPGLFLTIPKRMGFELLEKMNMSIISAVGHIWGKEDPEKKGDKAENGIDASGQGGNKKDRLRVLFNTTLCPQNIKYTTGLELLSDARKKTEKLIDRLFEKRRHVIKPRTDRNKARKEFLRVAKKKQRTYKELCRAGSRQLSFLNRNLRSNDRLLDGYEGISLTMSDHKRLLVIREVYRQQRWMYAHNTDRINDRIVSIHQPNPRPMMRGKGSGTVEFRSKLHLPLMDGYAILERLSCNAFHDGKDLMKCIDRASSAF